MTRRLGLAAILVLAACGASQPPPPEDPSPAGPDRALGCTPPAGTSVAAAQADCNARGRDCRYQAALSCAGTQPPPEAAEAERKARREGRVGCDCVCPEDEMMCHTVPSSPQGPH